MGQSWSWVRLCVWTSQIILAQSGQVGCVAVGKDGLVDAYLIIDILDQDGQALSVAVRRGHAAHFATILIAIEPECLVGLYAAACFISMAETCSLRGYLKGHGNWVTALATPPDAVDTLVSVSRDKTLICWDLVGEEGDYGRPRKALHGHNHFISDVCLSSDGQFALTSSWDRELRLWDLQLGKSVRRFVGHRKDVLSVAFSPDNRQIVSASRDRTIKMWNILGQCKYEIAEDSHTDWISCVRLSPSPTVPCFVSCGWDKLVKVWDLATCQLKFNLIGHTGYVNCVTISPDGSLCASGGRDGSVMLWDLQQGQHLHTLEGTEEIHALCFSPSRYWLCAATSGSVKIWDLETKSVVDELRDESFVGPKNAQAPPCICMAWSSDGATLFCGHTDNLIRVWAVV